MAVLPRCQKPTRCLAYGRQHAQPKGNRNWTDQAIETTTEPQLISTFLSFKRRRKTGDFVCLNPSTGNVNWRRKCGVDFNRYSHESRIPLAYPLSNPGGTDRIAFLNPDYRFEIVSVLILDANNGDKIADFSIPTSNRFTSEHIFCDQLTTKDDRPEELLVGYYDYQSRRNVALILGPSNDTPSWEIKNKITFSAEKGRRAQRDLLLTTVKLDSPRSDYSTALVFSQSQGRLECRFPDSNENAWTRDQLEFQKLRTSENGDVLTLSTNTSMLYSIARDTGEVMWDAFLPSPRRRPWQREFPKPLSTTTKRSMSLIKYQENDFLAIDHRHRELALETKPIATIMSNLEHDERTVHKLPWARYITVPQTRSMVYQILTQACVSLFGFALPLLYLVQTFRQARFSIQWILFAPVVFAIMLLAINLYPRRLGWSENLISEFLVYGFSGLAPIAYLIAVVSAFASKKRSRILWVILPTLLIMIGLITLAIWFDSLPGEGDTYQITTESILLLVFMCVTIHGGLILIQFLINHGWNLIIGRLSSALSKPRSTQHA